MSTSVILLSCAADRPEPKETIMLMFEAIRSSDSLYLTGHIEMGQAARGIHDDLGIRDTAGVMNVDWVGTLLGSLTGDGSLRRRWLENQIVLGQTDVTGDTATVEVSFIDRVTRIQYYNKMRLVYRNDRWVITDFRTL